jgi:type III restriction enzyme
MKFKFNKNLDYQIDAINSVVSVFDNGENEVVSLAFSGNTSGGFLGQTGKVIFNPMKKDERLWLENLKRIQQKNNIKDVSNILGNDFSVEMETGTGKTYIYLRTILELARKYKLKKFIILVPSVAIREGVLKTLEQTKEHFKELFGEINFGYFAYNSDKLSEVREFAWSFDVTIMIMTIQSFNKDNAILNQTDRDDTYGEESYLSLIAQTRPVIIMDEPQNMETDLAKSSVEKLKPIFKLKYSATHKKTVNLLYRLSPVDAYRRNLVKKIEVYGVTDENSGDFIFEVVEIIGRRGQNPTARVFLEFKNADDTFGQREVILSWKDDLFAKTKNPKYKDCISRN